MAAFETSLALGVDGIELDVRTSSDGRVVVLHDETLDRTTTLRGPVAGWSASDLGRVGVPLLADVLRISRDVRVIVEIKGNDATLGRQVVDELRRADAIGRACVGGFHRAVLRAVRAAEPMLATSAAREEVRFALYRSWMRWPLTRAPFAGFQVPEHAGALRVVSPRFVTDAHRAGLGVQVWTVNDAARARQLLDWGVDALITDRPDLILPVVRAPLASA